MAKTMSIIRYKYKADRDFESVQFEGMSCSLGELKRLIVEKSSRSGTHHPKDDYDLIISNATTYEDYKDSSELIPRNTSVVVARRIRGTFESLTPSSNQKLVVSSDDIVNEYLRPAILHPTSFTTSATTNSASSTVVESKAIPLEMLTQSSNTNSTQELSEDERIKQVVKTSQSRYLPAHRSNTSYTCHHCKQPGHLRNQCPALLQSSSIHSTGNTSGSSVRGLASKTDGAPSIGLGSTTHSSHIITNQSPYQISHPNNHYNNTRSHYRGPNYLRHEPPPKKTTGIPRDTLIHVPRHIPGAYTDQRGASVIPRAEAQLIVENSEKKADALAQRNRQFQEKGVLPPAPPPSLLPTKSADEERPPDNLLCPICKQVYADAVITPCCHNSFCDDCIRTALVDSEDHECPCCHRQHVPIDHINPNLFLRNYVARWYEERQHKSLHSFMPPSHQTSIANPSTSQNLEHDSKLPSGSANIHNLDDDDDDEYDVAILSTTAPQSAVPIKTAPIVIRMQPTGKSPSPPQGMILTKPADMTFEDGKAPESDQMISSQKDMHSELSATTNDTGEKMLHKTSDTNDSEVGKSNRQTPPSQVAPMSTILSSPPTTTTTTMAGTTSVVPHYYPAPPHILPHQQHVHHGMMYPQPMPPTSATGLYPMQPNYYSPVAHVPYVGGHHPVGVPPIVPVSNVGMHHYPIHPLYPPAPLHHHPMNLAHVPPNQLNGYHVAHFDASNVPPLHQPNPAFAATSTSTMIGHPHQTGAQAISTSTLSKDEFYMKQRHLQRIHRSTSHRRSRSSSYSSYTSSDSRSSSFSRRDDRRRRSSSHSRSRQQATIRRRDDNRRPSPTHRQTRRSPPSNSKRRRSPARYRSPTYRDRVRAPPIKDNHSSSYRRPSPRPYRSTVDRERRRSPRPPPTIQQSIQRTIVYSRELSSSSKQHSNRDHHRTESPSKHRSSAKNDHTTPSSKTEGPSQAEPILPSSPMVLPPSDHKHTILSSTITTVNQDNPPDNLQVAETNATKQSNDDPVEDENSTNEKKRKKHHHHHHKKHRRHRSKSPNSKIKKRHHSKDNDGKPVVEDLTTNSVSVVVEAQ